MAALAVLGMASMTANATMVMQMGMNDLVGNADKVFRGTVMTKEPGMVSVGSGQLPTVVYTIRVDDPIKGDFGEKPVVTLTMLGNLKADNALVDGKVRLATLKINPDLSVGSDYVLFTSAPSSIGLSSTIGLDQGLFRIAPNADGRDMATNGIGNRYLFDGPVSYSQLKAAINSEIN
jgi:hypothetical protein